MPNQPPAGDVNYSDIGAQYARYRRPDPRIAQTVRTALGDARTVLNVGAGAGSYEPADRDVTAVEPSPVMRAQRANQLAPAIDAVAEALPFADGSFDASMTTFSVHQWRDVEAGLSEMRRVTRGPVLILTCDPTEVERFWLNDYASHVLAAEARRYPSLELMAEVLRGTFRVVPVPIPFDCSDGFNEAYYGRPEFLLDPEVRRVCSAWTFADDRAIAAFEEKLRSDLADGTWDARYGHLRTEPWFNGSLRLLIANPVS